MSDSFVHIPNDSIVTIQLCTAVLLPAQLGGTTSLGNFKADVSQFTFTELGIGFKVGDRNMFVGWSNVAALSW